MTPIFLRGVLSFLFSRDDREYAISYSNAVSENAPRFSTREAAEEALQRLQARGHFLGAVVAPVEAKPREVAEYAAGWGMTSRPEPYRRHRTRGAAAARK
jgi:hypothetical protein